MNTPTALLILAAACCGFTSCKSQEEKAREQALENRADHLEDQAKATKNAGDNAAKSVKDAAQTQADALKKEADRTRDQK